MRGLNSEQEEWSNTACLCKALSEDMSFHVILATSVAFVFRMLIPVNPRVVKVLECFNHGINSAAEVSADTVY